MAQNQLGGGVDKIYDKNVFSLRLKVSVLSAVRTCSGRVFHALAADEGVGGAAFFKVIIPTN